jgi:diguanylate cyclase (GGDEF)-like protein
VPAPISVPRPHEPVEDDSLQPLSGVFCDPDLERRYREHLAESWRGWVQAVAAVGVALHALLAVSDTLLLYPGGRFWVAIVARSLPALTGLAVLVAIPRYAHLVFRTPVVLGIEGTLLVSYLLAGLAVEGGLAGDGVAFAACLATIWVIAPISPWQTIAVAGPALAIWLTVQGFSEDLSGNEWANLVGGFALLLLVGYVGSLRLHLLDRAAFAQRLADQASTAELHQELRRQRGRQLLLGKMASRDSLTGVLNRATFLRLGGRLSRDAAAEGRPSAVVFLDLDHFKQINDELGHPVGDRLLVAVAEALLGSVSRGDLVARYGGDEFVVLLCDADAPTAMGVADRLRGNVEQIAAGYQTSGPGVSISVGVAECHGDLRVALELADNALYRAKRSGRNRTELSA